LAEAGQACTTKSAREGAVGLGLDFDAMLGVVIALSSAAFYKSMTSHAGHRVWQDVYRPVTPFGKIYLKLTVIDELLIVSFKEL
jgi:motility quorum-sensing regulator/GCU-specific mRNA interferase toxin